MEMNKLLQELWTKYTEMNQLPKRVFDLVGEKEESVFNDHIALRTFGTDELGISQMAEPFYLQGYQVCGSYIFRAKKLQAVHLEHPEPLMPKIFISELKVELLSSQSQKIIKQLLGQTTFLPNGMPLCLMGRPWEVKFSDYLELKKESEYAAWMAAHGFVPNHFTIFVNHLRELDTLEKMNSFLSENGIDMNESGGVIKGSPEQFFEQSSSLAELVEVEFLGEKRKVPGCYIEFARRYEIEPGKLFQGFITQSADKIFESTDIGQAS